MGKTTYFFATSFYAHMKEFGQIDGCIKLLQEIEQVFRLIQIVKKNILIGGY